MCPELDIENGAIQYRTPNATISSQIKVRTVALTECNLGSALVGNEVRICQSNGQWSGNNASCAACPDLEIDNGVIDCRIDLMSNQEPVRTVAVAKCNPGFALRGDERRICQSNGQNNAQWSGIEATCIGNLCSKNSFNIVRVICRDSLLHILYYTHNLLIGRCIIPQMSLYIHLCHAMVRN